MTKSSVTHHFNPLSSFVKQNVCQSLIVINWKLAKCTIPLWQAASKVICADGGANRLLDLMDTFPHNLSPRIDGITHKELEPIDTVIGDLDSVDLDQVTRFSPNVDVFRITEQDTHDLTKAIEYTRDQSLGDKEETGTGSGLQMITVTGALGGRFDHEMANLSTAIQYAQSPNTLNVIPSRLFDIQLEIDMEEIPYLSPIVLLGTSSMLYILQPGHNRIHVDWNHQKSTCGIIPIPGPVADISTTGLEWNFSQQSISMGELISSSNEIVEDIVEVHVTEPCIMSMELVCDVENGAWK
eukprot:TRINITY_DN2294_c0_g1_i3.p1 TRINITY_DN2294_c0_g1~~TRINITY_DN2294_c0_g1_i3.p1  ORF type:complete len:297 (-),score=68.97 TRINITY_DN2294_c0_g1_i3:118-1008(-)